MNTKTKIYVLLLVWGAAVIQLMINSSIDREEVMVEQVMSEGVETVTESTVKAFGLYSHEELAEETKEMIVKRVADKLGILSGYVITNEAQQEGTSMAYVTRLVKKGENGDTEVKLVTSYRKDSYEQAILEQYLMIDVDLKAQASSAVSSLKKQLQAFYTELGIDPEITMHMCTQRNGQLSQEQMDAEIDAFFEELDAKRVSYDDFSDVTVAYGYSKGIDDYVYQNKDKVNVEIAFSYDAKSDVTLVHTGVPFIDDAF